MAAFEHFPIHEMAVEHRWREGDERSLRHVLGPSDGWKWTQENPAGSSVNKKHSSALSASTFEESDRTWSSRLVPTALYGRMIGAHDQDMCARIAAFILLALAAAPALPAGSPQYRPQKLFSKDGIGPIVFSELVFSRKGNLYSLIAVAKNASGTAIRRSEFCIVTPQDGCFRTLYTNGIPNDPAWKAGQEMRWEVSFTPDRKLHAIDRATIAEHPDLVVFTKLHSIRRVYVNQIEGSNGPMARERLMALLVNSGCFQLAANAEEADAIIEVRAEIESRGEYSRSVGVTRGAALATGSGLASVNGNAARIGAALSGSAIAGGWQNNSGERVVQEVVTENLVFRLRLLSGETVWAWDDTKDCKDRRETCAINDMVTAAR